MIPNILKNFNLFVDGRGYAGRVEEVILPKLSVKTEEHRVGGMDIPIELDMGMNKLDCDFTISDYDPKILESFGLYNGAQVPLTLRGGLTDESAAVTPVVVTLRGAWREVDFGTWKVGQKTPLKGVGSRALLSIGNRHRDPGGNRCGEHGAHDQWKRPVAGSARRDRVVAGRAVW